MRAFPSHEQPADWHPEDIKAAVRKTGISLAGLAVENGLSASSGRKVLIRRSYLVQAIIAKRLGVTPQTIWPSRYDEDGQAIDRRRSGLLGNKRATVTAESKKRGSS